MGRLRDFEIRAALRTELRAIHADEPNTAIIDELSLRQGEARVDLAVVNGSLAGYEIKSDRDRLTRLPGQLAVYNVCFDTMTIVVGSRHLTRSFEAAPEEWGIWEATSVLDTVKFQIKREAKSNAQTDPESVVQLLWKEEVLNSLIETGVQPNRNSGRRQLWATLVASVEPQEIFRIVRDRLRARGDWRSGPTPFRGGGLSRSASKSRRYRENRGWWLSEGSQHHPG